MRRTPPRAQGAVSLGAGEELNVAVEVAQQ